MMNDVGIYRYEIKFNFGLARLKILNYKINVGNICNVTDKN